MRKQKKPITTGKKLFQWEAHDYHPHVRKWHWYATFVVLFFGLAGVSIYLDPQRGWITAFAFFVAAAFYFWSHKDGNDTHHIEIYEKALKIDQSTISLSQFSGYWFVYQENVAVINFEKKNSRRNEKISLQMGAHDPDFFRKNLLETQLTELTEKKESLLDLWVRALQL